MLPCRQPWIWSIIIYNMLFSFAVEIKLVKTSSPTPNRAKQRHQTAGTTLNYCMIQRIYRHKANRGLVASSRDGRYSYKIPPYFGKPNAASIRSWTNRTRQYLQGTADFQSCFGVTNFREYVVCPFTINL